MKAPVWLAGCSLLWGANAYQVPVLAIDSQGS